MSQRAHDFGEGEGREGGREGGLYNRMSKEAKIKYMKRTLERLPTQVTIATSSPCSVSISGPPSLPLAHVCCMRGRAASTAESTIPCATALCDSVRNKEDNCHNFVAFLLVF